MHGFNTGIFQLLVWFWDWISRHPGLYKLMFFLLLLWNRDPFCPEACEGTEMAAVARWGKSRLLFTDVHVCSILIYLR